MKVWAYHGIQSAFVRNSEYECTPFNGLHDLVETLKDNEWRAIEELCVICHGDKNGYLDLEPPLTYQNVNDTKPELIRLREYLSPEARIMFLACTAGGGEKGDSLLKQLSAIFAGCDVIAFNTVNEVKGPQPGRGAVQVFSRNSRRNDEWSEEAKWARNGAIVRPPFFEVTHFQARDPSFKNRCGADNCPGHAKVGDRCDPYKRRVWPTWPVSFDEIEKLKKAALNRGQTSRTPLGKEHHRRFGSHRPDLPTDKPGAGSFKRTRPLGH